MENKLNDLKLIIKECKYTNTYKMAWAKALVVICKEKIKKDKIIEITFNEIAEIMIQDYWNQTILYNLIQSNDKNVEPTIIQEIKILIEDYIKITNRQKDSFAEAEAELKNKLSSKYITTINNIASTLKKDVSWRFLYLNKQDYNLYLLNLTDKKILIDRDFANDISIIMKNYWN